MTEQSNTGWGMTVSRRFDTEGQARTAVDSLREAGFIEQEINVWQQEQIPESANEDAMARTVEGLLAGGVIGGLAGFFLTIAFTWSESERITEETTAVVTIAGALAGALIVAIAMTILSKRVSFSHPHEEHFVPGSVVTVQVGDRAEQARGVFDKLSS